MTHFNFSTTGTTVLILDDQGTSRAILTQIVRGLGSGLQVQEETTPDSALAWTGMHIADLVLVDYVMPGMNGIDFIQRLRQIAGYEHVPVIMITIKQDTQTRYAALDAGVTFLKAFFSITLPIIPKFE